MPPTLVVDTNNTVTRVRDPINGEYEVFQFSNCLRDSCGNTFPGQMSYAIDILQNPRYFDGFKGFTPNPNMVYVFNVSLILFLTVIKSNICFKNTQVPLRDDSVSVIDTSIPARGMDPCKVIYNLYPVDNNDTFKSDGSFQFLRGNNDVMGGYILSPLGKKINRLNIMYVN